MPARTRKRPSPPIAIAGAPSPEAIGSGLGLLAFLASPDGMKQAQGILAAMESAATANAEAVAAYGPADKIADLQDAAGADREAAAQALADARTEAKAIEAEATEQAKAQREQLEGERRQLGERETALGVAERDLAAAQAAFAKETAGLRQALAG